MIYGIVCSTFPSVHLHQPLVSIPSVDQLILLIFNFLTLPSTRNSLSNNLKAQAILNKILSIQFQCIYVHDAPFLKSQHSLGAILGQDPTIRIRKDFFGAKIGQLYCPNKFPLAAVHGRGIIFVKTLFTISSRLLLNTLCGAVTMIMSMVSKS